MFDSLATSDDEAKNHDGLSHSIAPVAGSISQIPSDLCRSGRREGFLFQARDDLLRDIEVCEHSLDVIEILEGIHEAEYLGS